MTTADLALRVQAFDGHGQGVGGCSCGWVGTAMVRAEGLTPEGGHVLMLSCPNCSRMICGSYAGAPDRAIHVRFTHHRTAFKRLGRPRTFRDWLGNHIPLPVLPVWANDLLRIFCWGHR
jgi:hypothetical protein